MVAMVKLMSIKSWEGEREMHGLFHFSGSFYALFSDLIFMLQVRFSPAPHYWGRVELLQFLPAG
jgi:hypothetical protein